MKSYQKPRMLGAVIPLVGVVALSGCSYLQRPGEVCSTQQTYDALEKVIVSGAPSDGDAEASLAGKLGAGFSPDAYLKLVGAYVSFKMPTVDAVDKDTGKVSCNGLLTLSGPQEAVIVGRTADPGAMDSPVPVNDQSSDHITYQVSYSAQRTADGTSSAIILNRSPQIAAIVQAFIAKAESMKTSPPAIPVPSEQPVENQVEPDPQQASPSDAANASDGDAADTSSPAPNANLDESTAEGHHTPNFLQNLQ